MNNIKFVPDIVTGRLTEDDAKSYFSRFGWFAFAFTLINISVQSIFSILAYRFFPDVYFSYLFWQILPIASMYAIAFPIAYTIIRPLPTVLPIDDKWKFKELVGGVCICMTLMIVGSYTSNIFINFFTSLRGSAIENPVEQSVNSMPLWATFVFVCVLAPILEEIFFRAFLCRKLLMLGEVYAVVLPSAFFALSHGNFYQIFYAFVIGCFFSFVYVRTGKLIYTIAFHMIVNFLGSFAISLVFKYVDVDAILSGSFVMSLPNLLGLIGFILYELITYGAIIAGLVILFKKRNSFKLQAGILPPPEKKGASCVMLNAGVAAAVAIFAFTLLTSVA